MQKFRFILALSLAFLTSADAFAARLKDIATIEGVSGTQVIGYGLVTGLSNTGDTQRSTMTIQSVASMMKRFGITVPQFNLRTRNVAAVMVTATVPSFLKKGAKFDIQVSSMGDAESLQGGILLMTPLSASDGTVYAMAQGAVSVGGYDFRANGSRVGRNVVTSGRVPGGALVEREIPGSFSNNQQLRIILREPDFTTANRVAQAVSGVVNGAIALDAGTIQVPLTGINEAQMIQTIARIEALQIVSDPAAKVVINERTGTIVVGGTVQLLPAVVAHGGLDIQIQRQLTASQPAPFSGGTTQVLDNSTLQALQQVTPPVVLPATTTVQEMATALTALKVSPHDLIAIFQALKEAGSLQGELIIQ